MNNYFNGAYLFGLAGGGLCAVAFLIVYFLGHEPISFTEIFGYFLLPIFVFFGIKNFRDNMNGGELYFSQGMTVGFFVYSILALISAGVIFMFLHLDPSVFESYKTSNLTLLEEKRQIIIAQIDEASYNSTLDNISNMTIFDVAINDFLRKVFPGLFFTIIVSIILKKSKA